MFLQKAVLVINFIFMKKLVFSLLFTMTIFIGFAQSGTGFSGVVVDSKTQKPLKGVVASVQNTALTEITNAEGKFTFKNVPKGSQLLMIKNQGYKDQLLAMEVVSGKILEIGIIPLEEDITQEQQLTLITITDNDLGDDNSGSENTAGLLQATRDVFNQAAAYNFGQARFSVRGIDNEYSTILVNGVLMNRMSDGRPQYANWGGLNDATRNQEFTNGTAPSDYIFGGIAGSQYMNTRASVYRVGSRISFLSTNTNYNFRVMGTHASGMDKNGWAFVISAGRRWAENGYFEGTNYAANSLFASVEKKINEKHSLNVTSIYAQNKRGKNSPNTQEVNDLMGVKYNSYWGWQEGEKRNSRFKEVEEPIFILTHYWKPTSKTKVQTNLSYQFGKIGNSRLDYQSVPNPDPTYYRKLPSYWTTYFYNDVHAPDYVAAENNRVAFMQNPQIDWADMYRVNYENIDNGSKFVLYEDRTNEKILTANTIINSQLADNIVLNAGAGYTQSKAENFKNLFDLLGGAYYNDINTFGVFPGQNQSDLNNPNRTVVEGDRYGYNYNLYSTRLDAFTQFKFTYKKVDFYLSQSFAKSSYQREGLYKNGYYPDSSFGKSTKYEFENFGFKGGLTYKITGKHFIDLNGLYMTKAPNNKDVFPNARVSDYAIPNLTNEKISSFDASYVIRAPKLKARLTGYYNETKNATDVAYYYGEGLSGSTNDYFVSEMATGQNKRNRGVEAGIEYQLTSTIKATAVAAYGEYVYTNNPDLKLSIDTFASIRPYGAARMEGYKVPGMPQQAYSFGLEYRDPKFWWIGANMNYLADNYLDVAPILRTDNFVTSSSTAVVAYDQALADQYLSQEKFNSFYLLNLTGGKSWKVNSFTFGFFASVNNVLDTQYKTGGFEQGRNATFSEVYQDHQGPNRSFGPKYFYGYGRTYMVNLYLNF